MPCIRAPTRPALAITGSLVTSQTRHRSHRCARDRVDGPATTQRHHRCIRHDSHPPEASAHGTSFEYHHEQIPRAQCPSFVIARHAATPTTPVRHEVRHQPRHVHCNVASRRSAWIVNARKRDPQRAFLHFFLHRDTRRPQRNESLRDSHSNACRLVSQRIHRANVISR